MSHTSQFEAYLEQHISEFSEPQSLLDWIEFCKEIESLMGDGFDCDGEQEEDGYSLDFIDELRDEGWSALQIADRIKEKRPEDRGYFQPATSEVSKHAN